MTGNLNSDIDILYSASNKLMQASSPAELLEAVSDYAREQGATHGNLFYTIGDGNPVPEQIEIVAGWTTGSQILAKPGARLSISSIEIEKARHTYTGFCELIEDVRISQTPLLKEIHREALANQGICSLAILALNNRGRWVGVVQFCWDYPHQFSDRDRRIFAGLTQQTAPIVDSIRLLATNRQRAERREILLKINEALSKATDETQIVLALAPYFQSTQASRIMLGYLDDLTEGPRPVAFWSNGIAELYDPAKHYVVNLTKKYNYVKLWYPYPEQVLFIENLAEDTRFDEDTRKKIMEDIPSRAMTTFPFFSSGKCIGVLSVGWLEPHRFSEEEKFIYTSLLPTLSATVASRRAYLAEQEARQERELLYLASEAINEANSFKEIVQAVTKTNFSSGDFYLNIFENFDHSTATYMDTVATGKNQFGIEGNRLWLDKIPVIKNNPRPGIYAFEDIANHPELDETTKATLVSQGIHSNLRVGLTRNDRILGTFGIDDSTPKVYTDREKRIMTGLGELVSAAVERIRLSTEKEASRRRAEALAQINGALLKAADEVTILEALAPYVELQGAGGLLLYYAESHDSADFADIKPVAIWKDGVAFSYPQKPIPVPPYDPIDFAIDTGIQKQLEQHQSEPLLFENIVGNPQFSEQDRLNWAATHNTRGLASLPLHSGGRYQGNLEIVWYNTHKFSEEEKYIYAQLLQTLPSVVAIRRAYLAEQEARREGELLYQASEAINAANTFQEIVDAVTKLNFSSGDFYLNIFENFDYDTARYFDIVATSTDLFKHQGARWWLNEFSLAKKYPRHGLYVNENIAENTEIDEESRRHFLGIGVQSNLRVSLSLNDRFMGGLGVDDPNPRHFSAQEKRLMEGIGDLASAAVERIRLRMETDASRQRAETLAHLNGALLQATDESSILRALVPYAESQGAMGMSLLYPDRNDSGELVDFTIVGLWHKGEMLAPDQIQQYVRPYILETELYKLATRDPERVLLMEDLLNDNRFSQSLREEWKHKRRTRALALHPLYSAGQWQGVFHIMWSEPHEFSDEERFIYNQLLQTLPSVVATRRAYLAEQAARHETEVAHQRAVSLAQINGALLQATDEASILSALAPFAESHGAASLVLTYTDDTEPITPASFKAKALWLLGAPVPFQDMDINLPMHDMVYAIRALSLREPGKPLFVENVTTDARLDETLRANFIAQHPTYRTRAEVVLGLYSGGRWQGSLVVIWFDEPHPFTEHEQYIYTQLLQTLPSVVATRRAYLAEQAARHETEAARQQAETLAQVNAALSQAADEHEILSAVARLAEDYGADLSILAYIVSTEGNPLDRVNIVALRTGDTKQSVPLNTLPVISFRVADYPLLRLVEANPNAPVFVEDVFNDSRTEEGNTREFAQRVEWGAAVLIPLKTTDHWQGTLSFVWKEKHLFPTEVRKLFAAIQPAVASVVAHRRAYLAEQQRVHQLETVAKVSAAATSILKEDELLETIAELTRISFRQYHFIIYLLDDQQELLVQTTDSAERLTIALSNERSLVARAAHTRQGIIVNDISNTSEYTLAPMTRNARSEMAVPMTTADKLIGVLDVQSREINRFTESDIWVMQTLADLIAVAIQNARLYQQAQELAAFEERNRLARELHDSVSQALYGIALGARTARTLLERDPARLSEPLDYVLSLAEAGLTEMRALIFDLRPDSLEEEGLIAALSKQAASIKARHGIQMTTEFSDEPPLPIAIKEGLYWIAREALHNTVKHAQANQVMLRVNCDVHEILLEIKDNGLGFDTAGAFPGHLGLHSMRDRATRLNGLLEIDSTPGQGTHIRVHVPRVPEPP